MLPHSYSCGRTASTLYRDRFSRLFKRMTERAMPNIMKKRRKERYLSLRLIKYSIYTFELKLPIN